MIKYLTLLIAAAVLAGQAHADISDPGNLAIDGQALIGGTATVKGNAFSVGGSTFTISAGTITAGVVLQVSSAGIKWADGTTSTTASAGSSAGGKLVQFASSTSTDVWTTTATIPYDDTIPQITEGFQVLSATITPSASTNKLLIRTLINASSLAGGFTMISALFQGSGANAIAASVEGNPDQDRFVALTLTHVMLAGTTSPTVFSIRVGAGSSTTGINAVGSNRKLGGILESSLTIEEIQP